jgi:hypothetical protein
MGKKGFIDVDPNNLKSAMYYDELPKDLVQRAKRLFPVVKRLFTTYSLKDWVNGFKYDLYPEREIAKWEDAVKYYLVETKWKKVSAEMNKAIWVEILNKMNKENSIQISDKDIPSG